MAPATTRVRMMPVHHIADANGCRPDTGVHLPPNTLSQCAPC
jgi:hypothetical protein